MHTLLVVLALLLMTTTSEAKPFKIKTPRPNDLLTPQSVAPVASEKELRKRAEERAGPRRLPPIWKRLRRVAHATMPHHKSKDFKAVWVPVLVAGAEHKVAGVGLKGRF